MPRSGRLRPLQSTYLVPLEGAAQASGWWLDNVLFVELGVVHGGGWQGEHKCEAQVRKWLGPLRYQVQGCVGGKQCACDARKRAVGAQERPHARVQILGAHTDVLGAGRRGRVSRQAHVAAVGGLCVREDAKTT